MQKQRLDMPSFGNGVYCCCQTILIYYGIYLIALHCFLQGVYGMGVVATSAHKSQNNVINYTTIASNFCLIPTGILVFWSNLYNNWKGMTVTCIIVTAVSLFNLVTAILYLSTYINFKANSLLDQDLFWKDSDDWVGSKDFPFLIWHILVIYLILVNGVGFYYSFVMFKFSRILKQQEKHQWSSSRLAYDNKNESKTSALGRYTEYNTKSNFE